jgi:hypothetical protein
MILIAKHFNPAAGAVLGLMIGIVTLAIGVATHNSLLTFGGGSSVLIGIARTSQSAKSRFAGTGR